MISPTAQGEETPEVGGIGGAGGVRCVPYSNARHVGLHVTVGGGEGRELEAGGWRLEAGGNIFKCEQEEQLGWTCVEADEAGGIIIILGCCGCCYHLSMSPFDIITPVRVTESCGCRPERFLFIRESKQ